RSGRSSRSLRRISGSTARRRRSASAPSPASSPPSAPPASRQPKPSEPYELRRHPLADSKPARRRAMADAVGLPRPPGDDHRPPAPSSEARLNTGLFFATTEHGSEHGPVLVVLLAIGVAGALVYLVVRFRRRSDADRTDRPGRRNERATSRTVSGTGPAAS